MIFFISACSRSTMSFGVFAGTSRMCQDTASKSGALAASENGGTSGRSGSRLDADTASARSWPSLISGIEAPASTKPDVDVARGQIGDRLSGLAVRHVDRVEAEPLLGEFHRKVLQAAGADRRVVERRLGLLGVVDELRHRLGRQARIDHQDERRFHIERNRHEVVFRVVVDLLVERLIDRHRRAGQHHQRMAVRRRRSRPALAASMVAAPGLFSTTTGLPSTADSFSA